MICSQDSEHFSVTLHHEREFVRVNRDEIIYRGGVDSIVTGIHVANSTMDNNGKLVSRLGYKDGSFMLWTKFLEIQEGYILLRKYDEYANYASYFSSINNNGDLFVEHYMGNMDPGDNKPNCVNKEKKWMG